MSEYTLIRSGRRTIAIEVHPEKGVLVRAPNRAPKSAIEAFVAANRDWIARKLETQSQRKALLPPEPTEEARSDAILRARRILPERVAYYAEIMSVMPTGITVTNARTRFGSCSPKNRICFSWRLMLYPMDAIDYVVVHELAHILHQNHGAAFYACIERVLPDYKARRLLLNPR